MRLDDARGASPVAPLHRLDQRDMFGHQLRRIVIPDISDADAHQPVGLSDQIAQRAGHAAVAGGMRQRGVKGAIVGDEVLMIAREVPEIVERLERAVRRVLDGFSDAGRLQEITRVRERDRIDPVALARLHRDQMFALEPQTAPRVPAGG